MSLQVGYDITPTEETPLCETLSFGLEKHLDALEEISGVASKEHALEKAMMKMKEEWADVCFVFIPYRDTGVCGDVTLSWKHVIMTTYSHYNNMSQ